MGHHPRLRGKPNRIRILPTIRLQSQSTHALTAYGSQALHISISLQRNHHIQSTVLACSKPNSQHSIRMTSNILPTNQSALLSSPRKQLTYTLHPQRGTSHPPRRYPDLKSAYNCVDYLPRARNPISTVPAGGTPSDCSEYSPSPVAQRHWRN